MNTEIKTLKRDAERRKRIELSMDAGHGSCLLRGSAVAEMTEQSLLVFDGQRYRMLAWVIMPNYLHTLFQPIDAWTVAQIVASWKKFTARLIPSIPVWQREYWDRFIRNEDHLAVAIAYIHNNPVKAGLVTQKRSQSRALIFLLTSLIFCAIT